MGELDIDTAVKRYAEGDRSPEVMKVLNKVSDGAFQSPPQKAGEPSKDEEDDPDLWWKDQQRVAPLSTERLIHWASTRAYSYYPQVGKDRVLVRFRYSHERDRSVDLTLTVEGKKHTVLKIDIVGNKRVEPQNFVKALRLVNHWNQEYRWPRAMVRQDYRSDWDESEKPTEEVLAGFEETKSSSFALDYQMYLPEGIHQAGLEAVINDVLASSWNFWEVAAREWGL